MCIYIYVSFFCFFFFILRDLQLSVYLEIILLDSPISNPLTGDNRMPSFPHEEYISLMPEGRYESGAVLSMKPPDIQAFDPDQVIFSAKNKN